MWWYTRKKKTVDCNYFQQQYASRMLTEEMGSSFNWYQKGQMFPYVSPLQVLCLAVRHRLRCSYCVPIGVWGCVCVFSLLSQCWTCSLLHDRFGFNFNKVFPLYVKLCQIQFIKYKQKVFFLVLWSAHVLQSRLSSAYFKNILLCLVNSVLEEVFRSFTLSKMPHFRLQYVSCPVELQKSENSRNQRNSFTLLVKSANYHFWKDGTIKCLAF